MLFERVSGLFWGFIEYIVLGNTGMLADRHLDSGDLFLVMAAPGPRCFEDGCMGLEFIARRLKRVGRFSARKLGREGMGMVRLSVGGVWSVFIVVGAC